MTMHQKMNVLKFMPKKGSFDFFLKELSLTIIFVVSCLHLFIILLCHLIVQTKNYKSPPHMVKFNEENIWLMKRIHKKRGTLSQPYGLHAKHLPVKVTRTLCSLLLWPLQIGCLS